MTKQKETHFSTSFAWRISSKGHNHIESFYSVPYTDTCSQRHHLRGGKCQSFKRAVTLYFFVPVNIVQHMQTMGKKCLCLFSCLRSEFEGETEVFVSGQGVVLHIFIRFWLFVMKTFDSRTTKLQSLQCNGIATKHSSLTPIESKPRKSLKIPGAVLANTITVKEQLATAGVSL